AMLASTEFPERPYGLLGTPFRSGALKTLALGIVVTRVFSKKVTHGLFAAEECKKAPKTGKLHRLSTGEKQAVGKSFSGWAPWLVLGDSFCRAPGGASRRLGPLCSGARVAIDPDGFDCFRP